MTRSDRDTQLQAARRVDWRFLLPDPGLGRVGYLGRADGALQEACASLARSFEPVGRSGVAFDVVVLVGPTVAALRAGATALRAGGWLYGELRGFRARRIATALAGLGFEEVALHWHRPSFAACEEIVPLEGHAVRSVLARRRARSPGKALVGQAIVRAGMLPWAIPCVSVVGRKSGGALP